MKYIIIILMMSLSTLCSAQYPSPDDKLHLAAGALISATTYTAIYSITKNKKKAFWMSFGTSALAGLTKELIDVSENEIFDTGEMLTTALGGLTVSTTINLFVGKNKKDYKKGIALVN